MWSLLLAASLVSVAACKFPELDELQPDAGEPDADPNARYSVTYMLSGMWWNGKLELSLEAQGYPEEQATLSGDGTGSFQTALRDGTPYVVRVLRTPVLHTCDIANGVGTVQGAVPPPAIVTCTDSIGPTYRFWSPRPQTVDTSADPIAITLSTLQQTLGVTIQGPATTMASTNVYPELRIVSLGEESNRGYLALPARDSPTEFLINLQFNLGDEAMASEDRIAVTRARGLVETYAYLKWFLVGAGDLAGTSVAAQTARFGDHAWPDAIVAYGAPGARDGRGAAYTFIAADETQSGDPVVFEDVSVSPSVSQIGAHFGHAIALSEDSQLLLVGAPLEDTPENDAGAAYLFRRTAVGGEWTREQRLLPSDPHDDLQFGHSVAIGGYVFVGAPFADGVGAVYVYSGGPPWQQVAKITAPYPGMGDRFGWRVSPTLGGVAISAPYEDSAQVGVSDAASNDDGAPDSGAVYVFKASNLGATWTLEKFIKSPNSSSGDRFGESLDTTREAMPNYYNDRIAVGAIGDSVDGSNGAAYVFRRRLDTSITVLEPWVIEGTLTTPTTSSAHLGDSISIRGNTVAVGSVENTISGAGSVSLFWRVGPDWVFAERVVAANPDPLDRFGTSVELLEDRLIVGAPSEDGRHDDMMADDLLDSGAVYVLR